MNKFLVTSAAILGAMLILGCDNKTETPQASPPPNPTPSAMPSATPTPTAAEKQAADVSKAVTDKAAATADQAAATTADAKDSAAAKLDEAKKELGEDPQTLLDKAMGYVKENKLTDAEAILTKLESVKGKLPAEWASRIDSLKTAITSAKAGAGALPGNLPAMGK